MKLWLISQTENIGYDTYDSAVVAAETEDQARGMNPGGDDYKWYDGKWWVKYPSGRVSLDRSYDWVHPKNVSVKLIGNAETDIKGVICASYNAG